MQHERLRRAVKYGTGLAVGATAAYLSGAFFDLDLAIIVGLSFGILIAQCLHCGRIARVIQETHGPSRLMFEKGKQMGYQQGWRDGHRSARPVVVPFHGEEVGASSAQFFSS